MENEVVLHQFPSINDSTVCVRISEFKDKKYIDLRQCFYPKGSQTLTYTRKGLTISADRIKELQKGIQLASDALMRGNKS
jgi:hypothetical protein